MSEELVIHVRIRKHIGYPLLFTALLFGWFPWLQGKMISMAVTLSEDPA